MAGEPTYFEIGVADADRGRTFYGELFDWRFEPGPSENGFAITGLNTPGGMHGDDAGAGPYLFFEVDDMEAALARVRELGGEVQETLVEDDEESIVRFGRFQLCRDDQGSPFGLHQPPSGSR
jgi:uncharacterized protein